MKQGEFQEFGITLRRFGTMIKLKDSAFATTAIYLCVILIGMVSAYFFLANFRSRMAEKNSAAQTQNDAQDQEVDDGNISFLAPRAQDVIYDQGAE
jgi:hypothetical protein